MATMRQIREGLEVLAKYVKEDEHCIDAQHDVLYAGPGGECQVSAWDAAKLEALGWYYEENFKTWARYT